MKFRTILEPRASSQPLEPDDTVVSLGSCFSQAIGNRLEQCAIPIDVTPMGILFNPMSIAALTERALDRRLFTRQDLTRDRQGIFHALDLESRRQNPDPEALLTELNRDLLIFADRLAQAKCMLVTFGTAWCFHYRPTGSIVGNCHKLSADLFDRRLCTVNQIVARWSDLLERLPRTVFTVSPVRHLNDGLHGNTLSKARLHLAIETLGNNFSHVEYFPAYEALNDDLRDYRFYADDLKHPSAMAEEYIFELFLDTYYTPKGRKILTDNRQRYRSTLHRPILS